MRKHKDFR